MTPLRMQHLFLSRHQTYTFCSIPHQIIKEKKSENPSNHKTATMLCNPLHDFIIDPFHDDPIHSILDRRIPISGSHKFLGDGRLTHHDIFNFSITSADENLCIRSPYP
jgi:hypothetical protein